MGDASNPFGPDFVVAPSQMFLTVMPGFPLCCSGGFDQIVPSSRCYVQNQKQGSTPTFWASDQIMESGLQQFHVSEVFSHMVRDLLEFLVKSFPIWQRFRNTLPCCFPANWHKNVSKA